MALLGAEIGNYEKKSNKIVVNVIQWDKQINGQALSVIKILTYDWCSDFH